MTEDAILTAANKIADTVDVMIAVARGEAMSPMMPPEHPERLKWVAMFADIIREAARET